MSSTSGAYGISSLAYLARARSRLDERTAETLFYAAFELRCGVESRIQEYLEPQDGVSKKRKRDYKISRLSRELEKISLPRDQVMRVTLVEESARSIGTLYYTPVTRSLRKRAEKLGDLLHARTDLDFVSEAQLSEIRRFLEETWEELRRSNLGDLLGSMLLNKSTGKAKMNVSVDPSLAAALRQKVKPGMSLSIRVEHLEEFPQELVLSRAVRIAGPGLALGLLLSSPLLGGRAVCSSGSSQAIRSHGVSSRPVSGLAS